MDLRSKLIFILVMIMVACATWLSFVKLMQRSEPQVVVCVDPGHPSEVNSGYSVQHGLTETNTNWLVAKKLRDLLEADPRIKVVMTRNTEDQLTYNSDRARIANENNAAIAVHLHCDAGPGRGFTVYYPDRTVKAKYIEGPSKEVIQSSQRAAHTIRSSMSRMLSGSLRDRGVKGDSKTYAGSRSGGLATSVCSAVPTVTVEMVFLTNRHDADFIRSDQGKLIMAAAIARGIRTYIRPELDKIDTQTARRNGSRQPSNG